ncbi:MAG: LacI family DNA-binding transcriptional regulator [bacterium]
MSNPITLLNVAAAAGVSESTVSLVMNGKAASRRISPATQARVLAVARQLGYQSDPTTRRFALCKGKPTRPTVPPAGISNGKSQMAEGEGKKSRQIGILLSVVSQSDVIALIPGLETVLAAEGYTLTILITPTDPTAIRERVSRLLTDRVSGILACPSVYAAVSAIVAGTCPVIVLWQGAGKAMLSGLGIPMEGAAPSAPVSAATPVIIPAQPMTPPKPVSIPVPTPVVLATPNDTAPTERRPPLFQEPEPPVLAPITEIIPPPATQQPSNPTTESPPAPETQQLDNSTTDSAPVAQLTRKGSHRQLELNLGPWQTAESEYA